MASTQTYAPTTVGAYVAQDLGRALALHGYGISLFADAQTPLDAVCQRMGIVPTHLLALLEKQAKMGTPYFAAHEMPLRLVVEYLRHAHHLFIRERIPFLLYLIGGLDVQTGHTDATEQGVVQDLRLIFPLFAEEFIAHIHEEEDTLFIYIHELLRALKIPGNPGQLWLKMAKRNLGDFAAEHQVHEDEMAGIRALTNNYALVPSMSLPLQVLYFELGRFEKDLATHAHLENTILLPKALRLEGYVRGTITTLALKN